MHVNAVDKAHFSRAARHHQRLRTNTIAKETHTPQQRTVGYARCSEDDIFSGSKVLRAVDLLCVFDSHFRDTLFKFGSIDNEASKDFAVETPHSRRRNHSFGRPTDAHHRMNSGAEDGRRNSGGEIAITNQLDACTGRTNLVDEPFMAGAIQNDDHKILYVAIKA